MRAACKAKPGEKLVEAIEHQSKFHADRAEGTLVGFWSPAYSSAISVPGYHFHFINTARTFGGHVFDLSAESLQISLHQETDIHLAIPETKQFLETDLQSAPGDGLDAAKKEPQ